MSELSFFDTKILVYARDLSEADRQKRTHDLQLRYQISWWDSLILAAAVLSDWSVLYAEDLSGAT